MTPLVERPALGLFQRIRHVAERPENEPHRHRRADERAYHAIEADGDLLDGLLVGHFAHPKRLAAAYHAAATAPTTAAARSGSVRM